jgi:hypothetical protein
MFMTVEMAGQRPDPPRAPSHERRDEASPFLPLHEIRVLERQGRLPRPWPDFSANEGR